MSMHTLRSAREKLILLLIALLPLHALFVTVSTKIFAGPGHRPLVLLALWKEIFLLVLVLLAIIEIVQAFRGTKSCRSVDFLDAGILIILGYAVIHACFLGDGVASKQFLLGLKYDFFPLIIFFLLRRCAWSSDFLARAGKVVLGVGVCIAVLGLFSLFLPMHVLVMLGYSDLHSLYVPTSSLAAFQMIGETALRRMQSTMSGPNQLGLWLLLPLAFALSLPVLRQKRWFKSCISIFLLGGIILTFSRSAWLAAFTMILMRSVLVLRGRRLSCSALCGGGCFVACAAITLAILFPSIIFRIHSSSDHLRKPMEALRIIAEHPFGLGLGTAGPASNAVSDTCVKLPPGSDASWAAGRSDLCVFVGETQAQPLDRSCHCPLLTENWYLQWGVEMGIIGILMSIVLPLSVIALHLRKKTMSWVILAYGGLTVAGLFLHAFEDSAVAYTLWILLAASPALQRSSLILAQRTEAI